MRRTHPPPDAPAPAPVGTYAHTFDRAGTFSYRCTVQDGMTGRVVVTGS